MPMPFLCFRKGRRRCYPSLPILNDEWLAWIAWPVLSAFGVVTPYFRARTIYANRGGPCCEAWPAAAIAYRSR